MHRPTVASLRTAGWRAIVVTLATLNGACGGTVRETPTDGGIDSDGPLDAGPRTDAAVDAGLDAGDLAACRTSDGIHLCGGACPTLGRDQCPGVGCQPLLDRVSGEPTGIGVCVPDLPIPIEHCGRCEDGEVCASVSGEGTICVPEALCKRLHALGLASSCRYADFTPYDGQPLAIARGTECPAAACGPGCAVTTDCILRGEERCTGRSARHGYGFCVNNWESLPCNPSQPLPRSCSGYACMAWSPPAPNDTVSLEYGFCDDPFRECSAGDGRLVCSVQ